MPKEPPLQGWTLVVAVLLAISAALAILVALVGH